MLNLPISVGVALMVAGGTALAAGFGAFDDLAGDYKECAWHIDVPLETSGSGSIRMTFNNSVGALSVRACAFDADGFQRVDQQFDVPLSDAHVVDLPVPTGSFLLVVQIHTGEGDADLHSIIDSTGCLDHALSKEFPVGRFNATAAMAFAPNASRTDRPQPLRDSIWFGLRPAQCLATGAVVEKERPDSEGSSFDFGGFALSGGPGLGLGSILSVAGLMLLGVTKGTGIVLGAAGLYSRLVRPRILDQQPTRSRIVDLVEHRPGIRFQEIASTLGLGQGTAIHHLHVLVTQKVLTRHRHAYFVAGKFGRDEMRRTVALAAPTARAMYDALNLKSDKRVVDLALELGVTRSWATKVAKDLEEAGLVQRRRVGRTCWVDLVPPRPVV